MPAVWKRGKTHQGRIQRLGLSPPQTTLGAILCLSSLPQPHSPQCPPPPFMQSVLPSHFCPSFLTIIILFLLFSTGASSPPSHPPRVLLNNRLTPVYRSVLKLSDQSLMSLRRILFTFETSEMSSTLKVRSLIHSADASLFPTSACR